MERSSSTALAEYIESQFEQLIRSQVEQIVQSINLEKFIQIAVEQYFYKYGVDSSIVENNFEDRIAKSVGEKLIGSNIKWGNYTLSGDLVRGGCIKNFSSTGIVDQANDIELVVKDGEVIVESTAIIRNLQVVEDTIIEGNLTVNGTITGDNRFTDTISKSVTSSITEYVDNRLSNLTFSEDSVIKFGNQEVLAKGRLGASITDSNIRSLGLLKELQVSGESLLGDTLAVTKTKRVGINTQEPDSTLTIWDEEVKLSVKKLSKKQGYIGVAANQSLTLGIDDAQVITIDNNKTAIHTDLTLKGYVISYSSTVPGHKAVAGSICFNTRPKSGDYAGWINTGDTRWAGFGKIS